MLTCIAVDDEPLALDMLCAHIRKTPFLELKGRFASALQALKALREQPVDVVFLDIEMPALNGLELARVLAAGEHRTTRVVFTTAYTQFALEGYKVDALDYLLKPFTYEDFLRVALKAQAYVDHIRPAAPAAEAAVVFKSGHKLVRVPLADITYVEGLKDYVKVYRSTPGSDSEVLVYGSLRTMEEKLPPTRFLRIHRSFIVNLARIESVTRSEVQIGRTLVPISSQYREAFEAFLKTWT